MNTDFLADEREIALQDLVACYSEAAERFSSLASLLDDKSLAARFAGLAQRKKEQLEKLVEQVRALGYRVRDVDEEKELFEEMYITLKAMISADKNELLLEELLKEEEICRQKIDAVLEHDLPPDFTALLERQRQEAGHELRDIKSDGER